MAKKKKTRRARGFTLPLSIVAPLGMYTVERGKDFVDGVSAQVVGDRVVQHWTGYSIIDNTWQWQRLKQGLLPVGVGIIVHKAATKLGLNRAIAAAGIPFVRI